MKTWINKAEQRAILGLRPYGTYNQYIPQKNYAILTAGRTVEKARVCLELGGQRESQLRAEELLGINHCGKVMGWVLSR